MNPLDHAANVLEEIADNWPEPHKTGPEGCECDWCNIRAAIRQVIEFLDDVRDRGNQWGTK